MDQGAGSLGRAFATGSVCACFSIGRGGQARGASGRVQGAADSASNESPTRCRQDCSPAVAPPCRSLSLGRPASDWLPVLTAPRTSSRPTQSRPLRRDPALRPPYRRHGIRSSRRAARRRRHSHRLASQAGGLHAGGWEAGRPGCVRLLMTSCRRWILCGREEALSRLHCSKRARRAPSPRSLPPARHPRDAAGSRRTQVPSDFDRDRRPGKPGMVACVPRHSQQCLQRRSCGGTAVMRAAEH